MTDLLARHLAPKKGPASRYPIREVVEERAVKAIEDAIEEIIPKPGSWLTVTAADRTFHFEGEADRWKFRHMVIQSDGS